MRTKVPISRVSTVALWLRCRLSDGPVPVARLRADALSGPTTEAELQAAKRRLGIVSLRRGGTSYWALPSSVEADPVPPTPPAEATPASAPVQATRDRYRHWRHGRPPLCEDLPSRVGVLLDAIVFAGGQIVLDTDPPRIVPPPSPGLNALGLRHHAALQDALQQAVGLLAAYRLSWSLRATGPREAVEAACREIVRLEHVADPSAAWLALRHAASVYHTETGTCPFCWERGPLHLPADTIERELTPSATA